MELCLTYYDHENRPSCSGGWIWGAMPRNKLYILIEQLTLRPICRADPVVSININLGMLEVLSDESIGLRNQLCQLVSRRLQRFKIYQLGLL